MRWIWLVAVAAACGEEPGQGRPAGNGNGGGEDQEGPDGLQTGETALPPPETTLEVHECEGTEAYTFEWNATMEIGDYHSVVVWQELSPEYREKYAGIYGIPLADVPAATRFDTLEIRPNGHLLGSCTGAIQSLTEGHLYSRITLVVGP